MGIDRAAPTIKTACCSISMPRPSWSNELFCNCLFRMFLLNHENTKQRKRDRRPRPFRSNELFCNCLFRVFVLSSFRVSLSSCRSGEIVSESDGSPRVSNRRRHDGKEWLESDEPGRILETLGEKASLRKLRLFACACCRLLPEHVAAIRPGGLALYPYADMDKETLRVFDLAEKYADTRFPIGRQNVHINPQDAALRRLCWPTPSRKPAARMLTCSATAGRRGSMSGAVGSLI